MQLRSWAILAALAIGRAGFGYQYQSIAALATTIVPRYSLTYAQLGSLIGAYMLLGVFAALPLGLLGRRFGDKFILGGGLFLMTVGACVSAGLGGILPEGPATIALGRTIAGTGAVAMTVLQGKVIADWFNGPRFMIGVSISVCFYPVGMGLAQLVLPPLLAAHGLRIALLSNAVPAALATLLFFISHRTAPDIAPVPRRFSFPSPHECLLLVIASLVWTSYTAGFASFASFLPTALSVRGIGAATIATVMALITWGNVPGTLGGGGLAARFGGFNIFLIGTASLAIGMVGLTLSAAPVPWSILIGVGGAIQPGVIMAVSTLSARPQNRAVGLGLFYTLYYLGGTLTPGLCGIAADAYGSPAGGLLAAAAIVALGIPIYMIHRAIGRHETMLANP
jgi:MFS family permease